MLLVYFGVDIELKRKFSIFHNYDVGYEGGYNKGRGRRCYYIQLQANIQSGDIISLQTPNISSSDVLSRVIVYLPSISHWQAFAVRPYVARLFGFY